MSLHIQNLELMKWIKKGRIYQPDANHPFGSTRLMCPTPLRLENDLLRIYAGFCDQNGISRVGYIDVNPQNPLQIIDISSQPLLDIGEDGTFDDNGVVPHSIVRKDHKVYLYYTGFQRGVKVDYYMFCGLAVSDDNGQSFSRVQKTPILDRNNEDLYARAGVCVLPEPNNWKMWYIGSKGDGWVIHHGKKLPYYTMKQIDSKDGIEWGNTSGKEVMAFKNEDEHGFGQPTVFLKDRNYHMIYPIRTLSKGYYLGYACSKDGYNWERKDDELKLEGTIEKWENLNTSYPSVIEIDGEILMFYNGNSMGKTGFGYAKLIEE